MAVNETIVTGRKFRKLVDSATKSWQRISFWHKASDCEFDDGKTAQTKVGAISGITSDLSGESENVAASIKCVNSLNNSLGGLKFGKDGDGNYGYYGADGSLVPFSQISIGKFTAVNGTKTINVGFKPKAVIIMSTRTGTFFENVYYYDANNDLVVTGFWGSSSSWGVKSLTPTGFTYKYDSSYDVKYIAFKSNQGFPLKANADNIFK